MRSDHVLLFYVLCDESFSMMDHIEAVNEGFWLLHRSIGADPAMAERLRLCVVGFSRSPRMVLPLSRLSECGEFSVRTTEAASNFGAAFAFLRETIERDVGSLEERSVRVHRPAVCVVSDGQPTDPATWPAAFAALTDPSWPARPNMIAFGVGDADPATIARIGTFRAFTCQDGVGPAAVYPCLVHMWSSGGVQAV